MILTAVQVNCVLLKAIQTSLSFTMLVRIIIQKEFNLKICVKSMALSFIIMSHVTLVTSVNCTLFFQQLIVSAIKKQIGQLKAPLPGMQTNQKLIKKKLLQKMTFQIYKNLVFSTQTGVHQTTMKPWHMRLSLSLSLKICLTEFSQIIPHNGIQNQILMSMTSKAELQSLP